MSGHSKWSQIKHKKGATDAKRGQLFSKLVKEITIAARSGSADPDANANLRSTMERAHSMGLPKDNIARAIARASGGDERVNLSEVLFEATAPGGIAMIIEGITYSKNRTISEIKHLLDERGGRLAEPGSLIWNFEKKGVLAINEDDNAGKTKDAIEGAIIESGADDFSVEEGVWTIETLFVERESVRKKLESQGIRVQENGHAYLPRTPAAATPEVRRSVNQLIDALLSHDDVQEVYTNIEN